MSNNDNYNEERVMNDVSGTKKTNSEKWATSMVQKNKEWIMNDFNGNRWIQ